MKDETMR